MMKNGIWTIAALILAQLLCYPGDVDAAPSDSLLTDNYWRQTSHRGSPDPEKLTIAGIDDDDHGTYQRYPYYAFVTSKRTGKLMLISDGALRASLDIIPESARMRDGKITAKYRITFESGTTEVKANRKAILSLNDEYCPDLGACFIVTGTGTLSDLPSEPDGSYEITKKKPDNAEQNKETYSDIFTKKQSNFSIMNDCWEIRKINPNNYQDDRCNGKPLFAVPPGSLNYTQFGDHIVPYGWLFASDVVAGGDSESTMSSTSAEVMNSFQNASGFSAGGSVTGGSPGIVSVTASFEITKNKSVTGKIDKIHDEQVSYSEHKYRNLEYALVADKQNLTMSNAFGLRIAKLQGIQKKQGQVPSRHLERLIFDFGTHYAYAGTYGATGSSFMMLTKEQMQSVVEKGVKMDQAWSASVGVTVFGQGGSVKAGGTTAHAKDQLSKLEEITENTFSDFKCYGGSGCSDAGQPGDGAAIPVYMDLRPISELFGPPFFKDEMTAVTLRGTIHGYIMASVFEKATQRETSTDKIQVVKVEVSEPPKDFMTSEHQYQLFHKDGDTNRFLSLSAPVWSGRHSRMSYQTDTSGILLTFVKHEKGNDPQIRDQDYVRIKLAREEDRAAGYPKDQVWLYMGNDSNVFVGEQQHDSPYMLWQIQLVLLPEHSRGAQGLAPVTLDREFRLYNKGYQLSLTTAPTNWVKGSTEGRKWALRK